MTHLDAQDWRPLKVTGFAELIGPIFTSTTNGGPTIYGLQTGPKHANVLNSIHGGVIQSFLDQIIAITAWLEVDRAPCVTVSMDTHFLGSAKPGDFLQANASVDHTTRSMIFASGRILGEDGPVASAKAVMRILRKAGNG